MYKKKSCYFRPTLELEILHIQIRPGKCCRVLVYVIILVFHTGAASFVRCSEQYTYLE